MSLVANKKFIQERPVDDLSTLEAEFPAVKPSTQMVVYVTRPSIQSMKTIAGHIRANNAIRGLNYKYQVVFVPRKTMICQRVFEEEGVLGDLELAEFQLDLVPFDSDVMSLELPLAFRECYLEGDRTALFNVAMSLMKLQATYGVIPEVLVAGHAAALVADMIFRLRAERGVDAHQGAPEIDRLILIDRLVDPVTPMLTPHTYEALLDEIYEIVATEIKVDGKFFDKPDRQVQYQLSSSEAVYQELRDVNFAAAPFTLKKHAQQLKNLYERRNTEDLKELRKIVQNIPSFQTEKLALTVHTHYTEQLQQISATPTFFETISMEQRMLDGGDLTSVLEFIDDLINRQEPLDRVLRLVCLYSVTQNGFKPKLYDSIRRDIVQAYGFEHMYTLHNLETVGLFRRAEKSIPFAHQRKAFRLSVEEADFFDAAEPPATAPTDIAYAYSGYAPLSVRLVELASVPGWQNIPSLPSLIPGPIGIRQQLLPEGARADVAERGEPSERRRVTLVCFLGGCTYTEISALRFLKTVSGGRGQPEEFLIATTKIINGSKLVQQLYEDLQTAVQASMARTANATAGPANS